MPDERFAEHLEHPQGAGHVPEGAAEASSGATACGDLVRMRVTVVGDTVADAGFDAAGCGATIAAASAAVELVRGVPLSAAARIATTDVSQALGGLSPGKLHAAELAADALARALGSAVAAASPTPAVARRTLVAMSGGVDSAVAALLAGAGGSEVIAVTLELWRDAHNDAERSCCSARAVQQARSLAHRLGLPHLTLDLRDAFAAGVVAPWMEGHARGLTPNPCVRCNGGVRIDAMLALADRVGAVTLTTGHYARHSADGLLRLAADPGKDQAYVLAGLDPAAIARLRFPLGDLTKSQVRAIAAEHGLPVASKPDSQDLCFLAGTGRAAFLERHAGLGERPGELVDEHGAVLGRHRGAHHFTVGQRRGIGVGGSERPLYVLATDVRANTVTVGARERLAVHSVRVRDARLHGPEGDVDAVKLRYRAAAVGCTLRGDAIALHEPVDAAAPGQTAVFLRGDAVLGCATIA